MTSKDAGDLPVAMDAPAPLARRVAELLDDGAPEGDAVERHLAAAERVVARLLREQSTSRTSALDLLAADALATYAFELAADRPDDIPQLAERAMARFAALAASAPSDADGASPPDLDFSRR
ncbi:hypothetical protein tb265_36030 [Gemmatimonadetes bacterium T265]|nr:hypothetical protein tb265_36030 [Gemmatimonadetes bacterium T265]